MKDSLLFKTKEAVIRIGGSARCGWPVPSEDIAMVCEAFVDLSAAYEKQQAFIDAFAEHFQALGLEFNSVIRDLKKLGNKTAGRVTR